MPAARFLALSLLLYVVLVSCGKDDAVYDVAIDFQPYVDRFVDQAAQRGIEIDFADTGLSIVFRKAAQTESSGVCRGNHEIEIEKLYWDDLTDEEREGLIFHELGHCELDRRHKNDLLANGEWASRMRGSPIPEELTAVINYTEERRAYYIEELFNQDVAAPDWVSISDEYDRTIADTVISLSDVSDFETSLGIPLSVDFEIEVTIDIQDNGSWMGFAWGGMELVDEMYVAYNGSKTFVIGSGNRVWGTMYQQKNFAELNNRINTITVRRRGPRYFVFVNETFVYWYDYKMPASNRFRSIVGSTNPPNFASVKVHLL